ncbi:hypothetical protein [Actinomadura sp. KC345]|uniref:hypothetical protein n=1 Tax=Actinomadura sp. KC345 TaxID=2530371 RepID=UPI001053665D|nr:hypothetical protein [Actinomadura sp. KC345]
MNALTSSLVTFCSARAPIRCTVAISRSTSESVTSRSRSTNSAANNVTAAAGELRARRRRCEGDSTTARARQDANTFGATSANRFSGSPIARIAVSLSISRNIDSRLMLPGIALISASTDSPSNSSSSPPAGPASAALDTSSGSAGLKSTNPRTRARAGASSRAAITANHFSSATCSADRTSRVTRSGAGGSISSARQCRSSSSRTRSGWRSACATSAASHCVSYSASTTPHTRNPR